MISGRIYLLLLAPSLLCCARQPATRSAGEPAEPVLVPGPPPGCRVALVVPALAGVDLARLAPGAALAGTWAGTGTGHCALARPPDGSDAIWMFGPTESGYRGEIQCVVDGVFSPRLLVVDSASPPAGSRGEFLGAAEYEPFVPPVRTGPASGIAGRVVPRPCPDGSWPGAPIEG